MPNGLLKTALLRLPTQILHDLPTKVLDNRLDDFHWVVPHDNPGTPLGMLALQKRGY